MESEEDLAERLVERQPIEEAEECLRQLDGRLIERLPIEGLRQQDDRPPGTTQSAATGMESPESFIHFEFTPHFERKLQSTETQRERNQLQDERERNQLLPRPQGAWTQMESDQDLAERLMERLPIEEAEERLRKLEEHLITVDVLGIANAQDLADECGFTERQHDAVLLSNVAWRAKYVKTKHFKNRKPEGKTVNFRHN